MSKFKRMNLTLRPQLLERLLCEYISGHAPSRSFVAEACSVSAVTSGKVANALVKCGFMDARVFSVGERRPSAHLLFNDRSSILVIDLSTSVYKMNVVNPNGKILLSLSHAYDSEISFDDNLNIFISRNGLKLKRSGLEFAAISVLYADEGRRSHDERASSLPSIAFSEYIGDVIFTILGRRVMSHITVSYAIAEAIRFRAIDLGPTDTGISSVFLGSRVSAFHVYSNGSVTVCSPESLLTKAELVDVENIRLISKEKSDALFSRLADFMDAAFSPSALLLDSDILSPDRETAEKISRKLTLTNNRAPSIYVRDSSFPLDCIGASRHALLSVIKRYITSNKA